MSDMAGQQPGLPPGSGAGGRPAPAPMPGYAEAPSGYAAAPAAHLLDYARMLYKRRWTAVAVFVVCVVAVALYTFTAVPVYEARGQLLINAENQNVVSFEQVVDENVATNTYYQTQYTLLRSRVLARRTIDTVNAWNHPELSGRASTGLVARVAGWFGGGPESAPAVEPAAPDPKETAAQSPAIDRFLARLTITPVSTSRLVDVKFRSQDAAFAARVVNALSTQYIDQNLEFKFLASKEASDWLTERLAEQRETVESSELALQRYREQGDAIALEDRQNIVVQKLADLNAAVTRAKTLRIEKEANYQQIKTLQADPERLHAHPAILANTFIQQLKVEVSNLQAQNAALSEKLGERHPDLIKVRQSLESAEARLQGEVGKVVQSIHNEYQAALAQERSMSGALESQKGEALSLNRRGIEYGALQREAESNRQVYESLLQRAKETGVSGELKTNNIRVVDAAEVPRRPVWPNRSRNMMLAVLGGLLFGIALALTFEYLDNRIKSPDELKNFLGLPFLGLVPALPSKGDASPMLNNGVPPNFSEAFRAVRTNVLFASATPGTRTMVITSAGPGEGKTVVAGNLAIAMAQAGQRVLLIDADMRRPRVHTLFELPQEPGLSNLMVGKAKASEAVIRTSVAGLWVLPAGVTPPNPAELLGSERFKDFLRQLHDYFDWVFIDSPPVMAVTDATIVAHETSGVLFVVGAEMTNRFTAKTAVERLESAQARFVGSVLNRVNFERNPYYYSQYYRREYSDYYTKADQA